LTGHVHEDNTLATVRQNRVAANYHWALSKVGCSSKIVEQAKQGSAIALLYLPTASECDIANAED